MWTRRACDGLDGHDFKSVLAQFFQQCSRDVGVAAASAETFHGRLCERVNARRWWLQSVCFVVHIFMEHRNAARAKCIVNSANQRANIGHEHANPAAPCGVKLRTSGCKWNVLMHQVHNVNADIVQAADVRLVLHLLRKFAGDFNRSHMTSAANNVRKIHGGKARTRANIHNACARANTRAFPSV